MKPLPHRYEVRIVGGPVGHASLASSGVPDLATAAPADFGGPGDAWSPEQLLVAAVEACFLLTFRALALASRIEGIVDRTNGGMRFAEIVLRPRIALPAGADLTRVRRALEKAEKTCGSSRRSLANTIATRDGSHDGGPRRVS